MQFLHCLGLRLFSHTDFFDLFLQIFEFGFFILAAQLFVNRFDLFVEVVLFLRLLHLPFHTRLNGAVELALFDLKFQQLNQALQTRLGRKQFQQSLFVFDGNAQLRSKCISKMRRVLITKRSLQRISLRFRRQTQMLFDQLANFLHQCVEARSVFVDHWSAFDQRHKSAIGVFDSHGGGTFATFHDDFDLAVILLLRLQNPAERTHVVNLIRRRFVDGGVVLGGEKDGAIGSQRLLERAH